MQDTGARTGHPGRRRCPAGEPRVPPAAQPGARAVRELLGRVHLPVADGRHLLPVRPRPGHRRARLYLADLDPGRRDAPGRPGLRRAGQPLPGGGRALPVQQVHGRPEVRLVRRLVLRDRAAGHGGGGGHRRGRLRRRARPRSVRLELQPQQPRDHPGRHAGPAGHPDHAEHHRRQDHGPGGAARRLRGDPRHVRHRDRARHPRLPPRPRLPDHHAERPARRSQPARPGLRRQLDRRRPGRGARAGLHLLRLRVGRRHLRGDQERGPAGPAGHAAGPDLGRDRLVRADRRAAAGHAGRRRLGRQDRPERRHPLYPRPAAAAACRKRCWA